VGGGVELDSLGTLANNWSTVSTLGDYEDGEHLVEWWLAGETEVLGENLPYYYFVHLKSYMTGSGANPGTAVGSQRLTAWATARSNL
jgi:hypothetical protein